MTYELKLRQVGNSVGVIIPKEALAKMGVGENDTIFLSESPEGYRVTPTSPDFAKAMAVADSLMKRYRNTLRELAK